MHYTIRVGKSCISKIIILSWNIQQWLKLNLCLWSWALRLPPPRCICYLLSSCYITHLQSKCTVSWYISVISRMNWNSVYKSLKEGQILTEIPQWKGFGLRSKTTSSISRQLRHLSTKGRRVRPLFAGPEDLGAADARPVLRVRLQRQELDGEGRHQTGSADGRDQGCDVTGGKLWSLELLLEEPLRRRLPEDCLVIDFNQSRMDGQLKNRQNRSNL